MKSRITLFVGENGSGKSTLLEAIALNAGFNPQSGGRNNLYADGSSTSNPFDDALTLAWLPKVTQGFFMRSESLFNFATYLDQMQKEFPAEPVYEPYGGRSLHRQSHGEAFLTLIANRFKSGLFILDEPEAALSPQRQLGLLRVMRALDLSGKVQLLVATHSPIVLAYPGAELFSLGPSGVTRIRFEETEHYQLMKTFINNPHGFVAHLFED